MGRVSERQREEYCQVRIENLELHLTPAGDLEVLQWEEESTWTIARFYPSKDTQRWNAHFIEDRPFHSEVNWQILRFLLQLGMNYLYWKGILALSES